MKKLIMVLVTAALSVGCSGGPSEADVQTAVKAGFTEHSWTSQVKPCGTAAGSSVGVTSIDTVKVVERGSYNADRSFWPITVTVSGKCNEDEKLLDANAKIPAKFTKNVRAELKKDGSTWVAYVGG